MASDIINIIITRHSPALRNQDNNLPEWLASIATTQPRIHFSPGQNGIQISLKHHYKHKMIDTGWKWLSSPVALDLNNLSAGSWLRVAGRILWLLLSRVAHSSRLRVHLNEFFSLRLQRNADLGGTENVKRCRCTTAPVGNYGGLRRSWNTSSKNKRMPS